MVSIININKFNFNHNKNKKKSLRRRDWSMWISIISFSQKYNMFHYLLNAPAIHTFKIMSYLIY